MKGIKANEEITFDYGMCLHPSPGAPHYEMKCSCGAKSNRHHPDGGWRNHPVGVSNFSRNWRNYS